MEKNKILLISDMRVGSRWLHYLLANLFDMGVSPEVDVKHLLESGEDCDIFRYMNENRIAKMHRATPIDVFNCKAGKDVKVIGVVREPRDRGVSLAFHNRYHKTFHHPQKDFKTDLEAVRYTVLQEPYYKESNERQFQLMYPPSSVYTLPVPLEDHNYIWVSYEWLKSDTMGCVSSIVEYLGYGDMPSSRVEAVVREHSFKNKTGGRDAGQEARGDLWARKGIIGDWANWFDEEMVSATADVHARYLQAIESAITLIEH